MSSDDVSLTSEQELVAITVGTPERLDGPVILVTPDPGWPALFEREATRLRRALGSRLGWCYLNAAIDCCTPASDRPDCGQQAPGRHGSRPGRP